MTPWLTVQALTEFIYIDFVVLRGFGAVQRVIQRTQVRPVAPAPNTVTAVVGAMKTAGALYVKPSMCLQRSAVVTRLLRRHGIAADMVIGCCLPPLRAHAWVEVAGEVVSDSLPGLEYFRVLDRW